MRTILFSNPRARAWVLPLAVGAVTLMGSPAHADKGEERGQGQGQGHGKGLGLGHGRGKPEGATAAPAVGDAGAASAAQVGANPGNKDDDDDDGVADEKPDQRQKRKGYIRKMKRELLEAAQANGKRLTEEQREAIKRHWRVSMRLWRIRHLAEVEGDKAALARVESILAKADERVKAKIKELGDKAPAGEGKPEAKPAAAPVGGDK